MLRSVVRTFFSCCTNPPFFLLNPVVRGPRGSSSRFKTMKSCSYRGGVSNTGSMADVLEIMGPLENFLSSDAVIYVTLLRKCIRCKNFLIGKLVLAHLVKLGVKSELFVSNILLDVCCKAGFLDDGFKLFDEMPQRDLISWCTIISGFVSHGFDLKAYIVFIGMLQSGLKPNHFVTSSVLKASAAAGIPELGVLVHCLATKCGLGFDRFVEVGLVCMYAKCGLLNNALKLFYEIPVKSSVSWNAIISGCIQNGYLMEAAQISLEMCQIGFRMDLVTLRIVMSAASALEMLDFSKLLHVYSIKLGFDTDSFLVAEFVRLLAMLGEVSYMSELFNVVKRPDVSLYALLISGYHLHGCREEALKLVKELFVADLKPKEGFWITILNICDSKEEVNQIHALILKIGFLSSISVGNALISMYIRCANMIEAYETFLKIEERDTVTWTTIMAGLTHNLHYIEALQTFQDFRKTELQPDEQCLATVINACTGLKAIDDGKKIHALAVKQGVEICKFIIASILHMYAECCYIGSAIRLFSLSSSSYGCDSILTNIMLAGYCWNSLPLEALELFKTKTQSGLIPDQFTISTLLGACADMKSLAAGEQIHCCVVKIGFEFSDIVVQNAIVNMYVKSGNIANACKFYYFMGRKNIIFYEMLMAGYLRQKGREDALILISNIRRSFLCSGLVAFARVLRASADLIGLQVGEVNLSERWKEDSQKLSGDNIISDYDFEENYEYGAEKMHFAPLGLFKQEGKDQKCYFYVDGIYFYEDFVSRLCEASPSPILSPLETPRLISSPKPAGLAP